MINPDLNLNNHWQQSNQKATRDGFGEMMVTLGKINENVVVLTADLAASTKTEAFAKIYPDRFYELGVAEQNMMGISAGLSSCGLIPYCTSYAVFSPGRNWEQLRNSVCLTKANVKIIATHVGLSVGADGATHQALEDIALTRVLPNLTVICPVDYEQAKKATMAIAKINGPVYLRLSRAVTTQITGEKTDFEIGKAQVLKFGEKVTIIATGMMVAEALKASEEIEGEVINLHTIKPLDIVAVAKSLSKTKKMIVIEEHQVAGGLGSAILEALVRINYPVPPTKLIGVNDKFGQSGTMNELFTHYGLTWEEVVKQSRFS